MGAITRAAANNITTGGVILPAGINDASVASISALSQVSAGDGITLISSQTASNSASINFTSGIDSTYRTYLFKFINIQGTNDAQFVQVNFSTDGGSNYNVTKTTTFFRAWHNEGDTDTNLAYNASFDLAQSTSPQWISTQAGSGSDESSSGELYLFSPSSTTYVKHFINRMNSYVYDDYTQDAFVSGYGNTTSAINAVQFSMSGGNINSGTIHMYGIA